MKLLLIDEEEIWKKRQMQRSCWFYCPQTRFSSRGESLVIYHLTLLINHLVFSEYPLRL